MACCEHLCQSCGGQFMDNQKIDICPYCKREGTITNWFDEESELISIETLENENED